MNNLINKTINFLIDHPLYVLLIIVVFVAFMFGGFNWYFSRKYDKDRQQYQTERDAWMTERPALLARAEEAEKRERAKEMEADAYKAAAEAGKKVDDATAQKIDEVVKEAANAEANAQIIVDCRTRADRLCSLFRSGDQRFNCKVIYDECAGL